MGDRWYMEVGIPPLHGGDYLTVHVHSVPYYLTLYQNCVGAIPNLNCAQLHLKEGKHSAKIIVFLSRRMFLMYLQG